MPTGARRRCAAGGRHACRSSEPSTARRGAQPPGAFRERLIRCRRHITNKENEHGQADRCDEAQDEGEEEPRQGQSDTRKIQEAGEGRAGAALQSAEARDETLPGGSEVEANSGTEPELPRKTKRALSAPFLLGARSLGPASLFPGTRARDSGHGRRDGPGRLLGLLLLAVAALLPFGHRDSSGSLAWAGRRGLGAARCFFRLLGLLRQPLLVFLQAHAVVAVARGVSHGAALFAVSPTARQGRRIRT